MEELEKLSTDIDEGNVQMTIKDYDNKINDLANEMKQIGTKVQ